MSARAGAVKFPVGLRGRARITQADWPFSGRERGRCMHHPCGRPGPGRIGVSCGEDSSA